MLPKQYRLTKNKDFARVAQQGKIIFSHVLNLKFIKNNLNYSRFGIIVSLKVSKKAVIRNKIKRRIRAILKENLFNIIQNYDFMILTKSGIENLDYSQIKSVLLKLFQKQNLIKP